MQNAEMCNFMQTSVDRIGSQAYTVSHGKQTTPTKDSRKGYRTMNAACFGMMMWEPKSATLILTPNCSM